LDIRFRLNAAFSREMGGLSFGCQLNDEPLSTPKLYVVTIDQLLCQIRCLCIAVADERLKIAYVPVVA
jgi:hypothetical protein